MPLCWELKFYVGANFFSGSEDSLFLSLGARYVSDHSHILVPSQHTHTTTPLPHNTTTLPHHNITTTITTSQPHHTNTTITTSQHHHTTTTITTSQHHHTKRGLAMPGFDESHQVDGTGVLVAIG
ncbi:hypothetical protein FHG87_013356 [Trinorchestia longiramus]|nr:hypothetical protein FHG87_013356 [Trinorchestia longiramus]